jgi:hypothetical protein
MSHFDLGGISPRKWGPAEAERFVRMLPRSLRILTVAECSSETLARPLADTPRELYAGSLVSFAEALDKAAGRDQFPALCSIRFYLPDQVEDHFYQSRVPDRIDPEEEKEFIEAFGSLESRVSRVDRKECFGAKGMPNAWPLHTRPEVD